MGNHQISPKRQHRPSESVGFNKVDHNDDRFVTIFKRGQRLCAKSAPPLDETLTWIPSNENAKVTFTVPALPCDVCAAVTGTFNGWTEHAMTKSDGEYDAQIRIPHGNHYYRILVNGRARFQSRETIEDHPKFGRVHSLFVGPADDSVNNHLEKPTVSSTKLNQWSQDMNVSLAFTDQPPPPRIPPHLLNILLNRKLPENCDPLLLPEPNSVMLRHLYALSIQNGIMILSTTIRYRRKFFTTCFYKPN